MKFRTREQLVDAMQLSAPLVLNPGTQFEVSGAAEDFLLQFEDGSLAILPALLFDALFQSAETEADDDPGMAGLELPTSMLSNAFGATVLDAVQAMVGDAPLAQPAWEPPGGRRFGNWQADDLEFLRRLQDAARDALPFEIAHVVTVEPGATMAGEHAFAGVVRLNDGRRFHVDVAGDLPSNIHDDDWFACKEIGLAGEAIQSVKQIVFPWTRPSGDNQHYQTDGPASELTLTIGAIVFRVTPTGEVAINTSRMRFKVECLSCAPGVGHGIHTGTTSPAGVISSHLVANHGWTYAQAAATDKP